MSHKLGVCIPYRNRKEHIDRLIPHLSKKLTEQGIEHAFYVGHQVDDKLLAYLDGAPPASAVPLYLEPDIGRAWLIGGRIVLRLKDTLLSPPFSIFHPLYWS